MLKIIKCGSEFDIPRSSVVRVDTTYDGILVTLRDNTEIRFTMSVSPQIKAMMPIVQNSKARIVKLNLDAAMMGKYGEVVTLVATEEPKLPTVIIAPPANTQTPPPPQNTNEQKDTNTVQKKKGGRPKGSKTTKKTEK